MVLYYCLLIAILVVVALLYELCKVCTIHYTVTVNTNPSHWHHVLSQDTT